MPTGRVFHDTGPAAERRCDRPVTVESGTQNDDRCQTMEALVGQEAQFVSNPVRKAEPVKSVTHGCSH